MTQKYTFRPFDPTPAEYAAIVHVYNHANPHEPGSVSTWQHWDQHRDPARSFTRYVVEDRENIGGYGFSVRTDTAANKFRFSIYILAEWETEELIDQFYGYIMGRCLDFAPTAFLCQTREDQNEKLAWLADQGFQKIMRYPRSVFAIDEFDPTSYAELRERIASQGLEIVSLAELSDRDPEWKRKAYDLEMLLNQDVPRPTSFSPPPFDKYVKTEFEGPDFMPELWLLALDGQKYVGMTSLWKSGDGMEILETGLTGVRRDYRRRVIAKALKSYIIEVAQRLGAQVIQAYNEENNPMFQLNLQLGFQAHPADLEWEKTLDGGRLGQAIP